MHLVSTHLDGPLFQGSANLTNQWESVAKSQDLRLPLLSFARLLYHCVQADLQQPKELKGSDHKTAKAVNAAHDTAWYNSIQVLPPYLDGSALMRFSHADMFYEYQGVTFVPCRQYLWCSNIIWLVCDSVFSVFLLTRTEDLIAIACLCFHVTVHSTKKLRASKATTPQTQCIVQRNVLTLELPLVCFYMFLFRFKQELRMQKLTVVATSK